MKNYLLCVFLSVFSVFSFASNQVRFSQETPLGLLSATENEIRLNQDVLFRVAPPEWGARGVTIHNFWGLGDKKKINIDGYTLKVDVEEYPEYTEHPRITSMGMGQSFMFDRNLLMKRIDPSTEAEF